MRLVTHRVLSTGVSHAADKDVEVCEMCWCTCARWQLVRLLRQVCCQHPAYRRPLGAQHCQLPCLAILIGFHCILALRPLPLRIADGPMSGDTKRCPSTGLAMQNLGNGSGSCIDTATSRTLVTHQGR